MQTIGCWLPDFFCLLHGGYISTHVNCPYPRSVGFPRLCPLQSFHNEDQYNHNPEYHTYGCLGKQIQDSDTELPPQDPEDNPAYPRYPEDHHHKIPGRPLLPEPFPSHLRARLHPQYKSILRLPRHWMDPHYKTDQQRSDTSLHLWPMQAYDNLGIFQTLSVLPS